MSVLGSNNLTLPLQTRVKERLQELRELGKPRFYKDENRQWHNVEPAMPIAGSLEYADVVQKRGDGSYTIRYQLYKTRKGVDGSPLVVEQLVGRAESGLSMKLIDCVVTELFEKGKLFKETKEAFIDPRLPLEPQASSKEAKSTTPSA